MSVAEVVLHGFMAWAVINTALMFVWVGLMWAEGGGRRAGRRRLDARQPWGGAQ